MKKKITETNDVTSFTQYGQFILNRTEKEIREHFSSNIISSLKNINSESNDIMLEIRLKNSTLTCLFENNICYSGLLFFDSLNSIENYINICNEKCKTVNLNIWKHLNYYIQLNFYNFDSFFSFSLQPYKIITDVSLSFHK
jgi:hypothetical protein